MRTFLAALSWSALRPHLLGQRLSTWLSPGAAASLGLVLVDEGVYDACDDRLLVLIQDVCGVGYELEARPIALTLVEEESIGRDPKSYTQTAQDLQGRRGEPVLVTTELGEMHAGTLSQLALGEPALCPESGKPLGELHRSPLSPLGVGTLTLIGPSTAKPPHRRDGKARLDGYGSHQVYEYTRSANDHVARFSKEVTL